MKCVDCNKVELKVGDTVIYPSLFGRSEIKLRSAKVTTVLEGGVKVLLDGSTDKRTAKVACRLWRLQQDD